MWFNDLRFKLHVWAMEHIRVYKALKYLSHMEGYMHNHGLLDAETNPEGHWPKESPLGFMQRMQYHQGHVDGEQHVGVHAYYWSGGEDEDYKYKVDTLHDHLEALVKDRQMLRAEIRKFRAAYFSLKRRKK